MPIDRWDRCLLLVVGGLLASGDCLRLPRQRPAGRAARGTTGRERVPVEQLLRRKGEGDEGRRVRGADRFEVDLQMESDNHLRPGHRRVAGDAHLASAQR